MMDRPADRTLTIHPREFQVLPSVKLSAERQVQLTVERRLRLAGFRTTTDGTELLPAWTRTENVDGSVTLKQWDN